MKRTICNPDLIKNKLSALVGKQVNVKVSRGRGKVKYYHGVLTSAHPNVFVVDVFGSVVDRVSYSYADVACGEIVVKPLSQNHAQV